MHMQMWIIIHQIQDESLQKGYLRGEEVKEIGSQESGKRNKKG